MWYYSATYYIPTRDQEETAYLELENHSDVLRNMDGFTTPTVIITGRNYHYIVQMLTPHFFEHHLVDTTIIHGDLHAEVASLQVSSQKRYYQREGYYIHSEGEARLLVPT